MVKRGIGLCLAMMAVSCQGMHRFGRLAPVVRGGLVSRAVRWQSTLYDRSMPFAVLDHDYKAQDLRSDNLKYLLHERLCSLNFYRCHGTMASFQMKLDVHDPVLHQLLDGILDYKKDLEHADSMLVGLRDQIRACYSLVEYPLK